MEHGNTRDTPYPVFPESPMASALRAPAPANLPGWADLYVGLRWEAALLRQQGEISQAMRVEYVADSIDFPEDATEEEVEAVVAYCDDRAALGW